MDGKGRALDNIFVERFFRTLKYENIYLNEYETPKSLRRGLNQYIKFYNEQRLHGSLGYRCPVDFYHQDLAQIALLSIGAILLGYSYAHEWYGILESEVQYWGYLSEALGLILLILILPRFKGVILTKVILFIGLIINIPPIILWFIFHGSIDSRDKT
ncbi:Ribonuclease H-like domain [Syntrophomonas zehnderi OL-4]|uniref:Ribonuclease H-like domain n=1 Tax=Syntrophomonas zehnderi OL-4 TaxID=690567 RepID=A0A0E4GA41_9FIRM|nr:Ribonuclease H-like domain [Syntrophomonas zehnderi OL-4]